MSDTYKPTPLFTNAQNVLYRAQAKLAEIGAAIKELERDKAYEQGKVESAQDILYLIKHQESKQL